MTVAIAFACAKIERSTFFAVPTSPKNIMSRIHWLHLKIGAKNRKFGAKNSKMYNAT